MFILLYAFYLFKTFQMNQLCQEELPCKLKFVIISINGFLLARTALLSPWLHAVL